MHKTTSVIPITFADLSPEFQKVIKKMQEVSFGVIHDLPIANGQPQLPQARVVRSCKLSNSRPNAQSKQNFQLCEQHLYFMSIVEQIQNGLIQRLEVQHGLPSPYAKSALRRFLTLTRRSDQAKHAIERRDSSL